MAFFVEEMLINKKNREEIKNAFDFLSAELDVFTNETQKKIDDNVAILKNNNEHMLIESLGI